LLWLSIRQGYASQQLLKNKKPLSKDRGKEINKIKICLIVPRRAGMLGLSAPAVFGGLE
jgi:hypothetical protein